jgi:hypothetical protein
MVVKFSIDETLDGHISVFSIKAEGEVVMDPKNMADDNGTPYEDLSDTAQRAVIEATVANHIAHNIPKDSIKYEIIER